MKRRRWLSWADSPPALSRPVQPVTSHFLVRVLRVLAARPEKREGSPQACLSPGLLTGEWPGHSMTPRASTVARTHGQRLQTWTSPWETGSVSD